MQTFSQMEEYYESTCRKLVEIIDLTTNYCTDQEDLETLNALKSLVVTGEIP